MSKVAELYKESVVPALMERFGYANVMQVPRLQKIVLNVGVGEATQNSKAIENVVYSMTQIAGQKPVVTRAKKSIANFKLRVGMPIGCMVTLRRSKMNDFFERLVTVALPRVKDFRGVPRKGFDGRGNYTLGIREEIVFPEINMDKLDRVRGLDVTFVTSAKNDEEGRALLEGLGFPFRK